MTPQLVSALFVRRFTGRQELLPPRPEKPARIYDMGEDNGGEWGRPKERCGRHPAWKAPKMVTVPCAVCKRPVEREASRVKATRKRGRQIVCGGAKCRSILSQRAKGLAV